MATPEKISSAQRVYSFGAGRTDGGAGLRELLGGKGANIAEMARLGIPVPPGFTITTEVCNHFMHHDGAYPDGLRDEVAHVVSVLGVQEVRRVGPSARAIWTVWVNNPRPMPWPKNAGATHRLSSQAVSSRSRRPYQPAISPSETALYTGLRVMYSVEICR